MHKHASGQARVRIAGKDYYLGRYGTPEAEEALAALLLRHARGELGADRPAPGPLPAAARTVGDVVAEWLAEVAPGYGARGREAKQFGRSLLPLVRLYGVLPADQMDAEKLDAVRRAMLSGSWLTLAERAALEARGQSPAWSSRVSARRVVRVRTVWRWAERRGLVPRGSWAHLRTLGPLGPAEAARRLPPRRPAEWADVLAVCRVLGRSRRAAPRRVRALLLACWWSGMRPGEARVMRPCDLDRSGPIWVYRPAEHKNDWREGHDRQVPLGPRCQAALRPLLAGAAPGDYLFPGRGGPAAPMTDLSLCQAMRRAAEKAGVSLTVYQLRHAFKKRVARAAGLEATRAAMGHRSVETTAAYASEVDSRAAQDVARRLG